MDHLAENCPYCEPSLDDPDVNEDHVYVRAQEDEQLFKPARTATRGLVRLSKERADATRRAAKPLRSPRPSHK